MGCRDGARFLPAQLASIAAQSHRNWRLVASDDGSTDATRGDPRSLPRRAGPERVEIRDGPARGLRRQLPRASPATRRSAPTATPSPTRTTSGIPTGWRAASRGSRALPPEGRRSTAARTLLIDEAGRETGRSPRFRAAPGFANALVQSIAGGNTMLFNAAAKRCSRGRGRRAVVAHDWWAYLLVSGAGGTGDLRPRAHGRATASTAAT